ncbi:helix-turn-helix domain-containing protein [Paraburkholderia sp. Ac-20347]|jgi:transcriptional regulator with XRE-family HTH domain|uniref:helix-turn-helix domain-containing protein n=1 Tax=Paraburkholderia sp. Ac-20347 TaxID=2703892 RepID=UPI00197D33C9|nr:helix-turn-helix domain-containing protein [Paraburkholderia sp. Ac-20347]MBN3810976.1 helix-turn-helix domain-containing protein [Paraburkholderia sp. Ac-20347]
MVSPLDEKAYVAATTGRRIRALRQRLRRTLQETAELAGISKPYLSQVERGRATPSLRSLIGIARALGVTLQYFIETPAEEQVVRRAERLKFFGFTGSANQYGRLTSQGGDRKLDAQLVKMPAGAQRFDVVAQATEEFLYVMSGEVSLTLEDTTFVLRAGDTAHFESAVPHAWANPSDTESVFVWVGTPKLI